MRRALPLIFLAGCAYGYRPPAQDEPHALVKVRRVHEQQVGDSLAESIAVDGSEAFAQSSVSSVARNPRTTAILVRPRATTIAVRSDFTHTETWTEEETYQETIPGTKTETYDCGTIDEPNTCTRVVDDSHTETRTRTVTRSAEVTDGACTNRVSFVPRDGGVYLLDFTYRSNRACTLVCYEQIPGSLSFRHC